MTPDLAQIRPAAAEIAATSSMRGDALQLYVRAESATFSSDTRILVHADTLKQHGLATGAYVVLMREEERIFAGKAWPAFELPKNAVSVPDVLAAPVSLRTGDSVSIHAVEQSSKRPPGTFASQVATALHVSITPLHAQEPTALLQSMLDCIIKHTIGEACVLLPCSRVSRHRSSGPGRALAGQIPGCHVRCVLYRC